jgi:beta-phosphoglucomutase
MTTPLAAIFDMDGVLVDSYDAHLESWAAVGREEGVTITAEQFATTFGRTSRDIIRAFWGVTSDAAVAHLDDRKEAAYRDIIRGAVPVMPGADELVQALHDDGWRIAVGSSGPPENVHLALEALRTHACFDAAITGRDVTHGKPDPEVFLLAASALEVDPERCIVFEDAPAGIEAAHAAGMACVGLVSTGRTLEELAAADLVVTALDDVDVSRLRGMLDA